jgi:quercetin dioxygenase-like cupin family protein
MFLDLGYIRNIQKAAVVDLSTLIEAKAGEITSKTLAQNKSCSVTLFAFDAGEEISAHTSQGDALVMVLQGSGKITIQDHDYDVEAGNSIIMPATVPHAVKAESADFKMLLVVVFE